MILVEGIVDRIVVEVAALLHLKGLVVEPSGVAELKTEPAAVGASGFHLGAVRVPPLLDGTTVPEPLSVHVWLIISEASDGRDNADPIFGLRLAAREVVFCQLADQLLTSEDKAEGIDDGAFARSVRADQGEVVR